MEEDIHAGLPAKAAIMGEGPRIAGEILTGPELGRIHINTYYDLAFRAGQFPRRAHEREMAGVKGAHRRDQDEGPTGVAREQALDAGGGLNNFHKRDSIAKDRLPLATSNRHRDI